MTNLNFQVNNSSSQSTIKNERSKLKKTSDSISIFLFINDDFHSVKTGNNQKRICLTINQPYDKKELLGFINDLIWEEFQNNHYEFKYLNCSNIEKHENVFLSHVFSIIEENYNSKEFNLLKFSELIHLERTQLYRKIKILTNLSPSELIRQKRLNIAQHLLVKSDLTISEVSIQCGFKNSSHFSKVFKSHFGKSPRAYRKGTLFQSEKQQNHKNATNGIN